MSFMSERTCVDYIEEFVKDTKIVYAVIRFPEILREAVKTFPWKRIENTRDKLIHGYFGADYEILWETIK